MTAAAANRWLFGPARDLLLGCGLLYACVLLVLAAGGDALQTRQPAYLIPLLVVFVSLPHYGATLLRVYEHRHDRRQYALFAVYASLLVLGAFVVGIYEPWVGALLFTVYITWSPWHYTGQNYGLAVMFLRRRGVDPAPELKRLIYASFVLSYALVVFTLHSDRGQGAVVYNTSADAAASIRFLRLGIPAALTDLAVPLLAAAYLACVAVCARRLLARATPRALLPVAALGLTQALWFALPFAVSYWQVRSGLSTDRAWVSIYDYPMWVALGHGAQYLWVTSYYARGSRGWHGYGRYLGKVFLAGIAIWTLPVVLFSPDLLGPASGVATVTLMVAACVNIHHFILDGAIWKLRDGRIARVLLRAPDAAAGALPNEAGAATWVRPLVWSLACGWLLFHVAGLVETRSARTAMEAQDLERMRASARRLRWLGVDDPEIHFRLGTAAGARGDLATARDEFERTLELGDRARGWVGLGTVEAASGRPDAARAALVSAVRAEPENPLAWAHSADVWLALGDSERGRAALARAAELAPARGDLRQRLAALDDPPADAGSRGSTR